MKLKRYQEGKINGYRVELAKAQMKKWIYLNPSGVIVVDGVITTLKVDREHVRDYVYVDGECYDITQQWTKDQKVHVVVYNNDLKSDAFKTFTTPQCIDCIIRLLIDLHNSIQKYYAVSNYSRKYDFDTWCKLKHGWGEDFIEVWSEQRWKEDGGEESGLTSWSYGQNELDTWGDYLRGDRDVEEDYYLPYSKRFYHKSA
jgi:hypothetical protein